MEIDEAIQEIAGLYQICVVDELKATIECQRKNEAIDMAIEALEKQEAKKPLQNEIEYPYMPNMIVTQCPSCHRRLRTKRTMAKGDGYCPDCGQKIDWMEP